MKTKLRMQRGFTIIEVLIVLAIAGLILLIVFLAVPALQRNSRNTQRKNEVASLLGGLSEFTNNNNGTYPATCGAADSATDDPNGNPSTANTITVGTVANNCFDGTNPGLDLWLKNVTTKFYDKTQVGFKKVTAIPASAPDGISDVNGVMIQNGLKCSGNTPTITGASLRSVIAMYGVESGGKNQAQCQESGS